MREILFRGKRQDNDEWVFGDFQENTNALKIREKEKYTRHIAKYWEVKDGTIGECTWFVDRFGKHIWEDDIVEWDRHVYLVVFERSKMCFALKSTDEIDCGRIKRDALAVKDAGMFCKHPTYLWDMCWECEVVGNIHDDLELFLGVKK